MDDLSRDETADVAVIGAGLAGLVAARDLRRAGLRPLVVEARDRVGGRTWTRPVPGGAVEAGGQFIGPTQDRLAALAGDLGVATFATYNVGRARIDLAGGREAYKRAKRLLTELEGMASELPPEAPWAAARAAEWDAQTFHDWLQGSGEQAAFGVMRMLTTAVFAAEPAELSLLHVLAYIRSAGSVDLLTEVAGGAQERRFVGGAQALSVRLADAVGGDDLRLGAPVHRVRQAPDGVEVSARDLTVRARRAIVAVPPVLGGRIEYDPPPDGRAGLHLRMAPGSTIKISCLYGTPFWRDEGLNGGLMRDRGPVTVTFDNSPPDGSHGVLVAFSQGDDARALARLPAGARREAVLEVLGRYFGERAARPSEYLETDWAGEPWTRGCFGGNFGPGGWTRYGPLLREPFDRVHWAGAETSAVWMNYMEGAVRSGERAAAEVIAALGVP
ncbi:flavin monoamine oxidase family protein [Actinomadura sp. WMMA1423]|uniref:flavin monoamine oxidase family protein n=1 Tax=Actinomadura sp. WMMA1423 TaxID=2591108 RepID=UPI00197AC433|nr:flavin monoamine oxidase family protein [Actinomadura sp. WMMA1423]